MAHSHVELQVSRLKDELETIISGNASDLRQLQEILSQLRSLEIDLHILKRTKIGLAVNKVRKTFHNSKDVAKHSVELLQSWKKIAKEQLRSRSKSESSVGSLDTSRNSAAAQSPTHSNSPGNDTSDKKNAPEGSEGNGDLWEEEEKPGKLKRPHDSHSSDEEVILHKKKSRSSSGGSLASPVGTEMAMGAPADATRAKSVQLIKEALKLSEASCERSGGEVDSLSVQIEEAIFNLEGRGTDRKYKSRLRSRVLNLRDHKNPGLRQKVLRGDVEPGRLAEMTSEEMASDDMRRFRESVNEESLKEHELPQEDAQGVHSDMFFCRKCQCRDTTYTISQERLRGEYDPVSVTLVVCNKCGNRWKTS